MKPLSRRATRGLAWLMRLVTGSVLVVAGAAKLKDPATFAADISNYRLMPALAPVLAATLPTTEVLVGIALLAFPRRWRRPAAVAALVLLLLFAAAVTSAYLRGIDVACGCFGGGGTAITGFTLLRNGALLAAALGILVWDRAEPAA